MFGYEVGNNLIPEPACDGYILFPFEDIFSA